MPITRELENLKKFEAVGFSHEQSETLADVIEQSHANGQQSLKEFIHNENSDFRKEVRHESESFRKEIRTEIKEVRTEINSLELRIRASLTDLLLKIFAIVVGCTSIAIAVVKVLE